jgi:hypothetical protein
VTGRFRITALLAEQGDVRSYRGVDSLTGLPVLIYRFSGQPATLRGLESNNIPGVLDTGFDGRKGEVVVAYAPDYRPLTEPVAPENVWPLLLDSSTALKDAAQANVAHGDLKPERFLRADHHHLIEGYGARWRPQPSPYTAPDALIGTSQAGDVYAWAKSVAYLCGPHLPKEIRPLIASCLAEDPRARPSAQTLFEAVHAPREALARSSGKAQGRPAADGNADAVRELPPGAKYRSGPEAESLPPAPLVVPKEKEKEKGVGFRPSSPRRLLLLLVLLIAVSLLALLALLSQRPAAFSPTSARGHTMSLSEEAHARHA